MSGAFPTIALTIGRGLEEEGREPLGGARGPQVGGVPGVGIPIQW